jgi:hypothetical protein
MSQFYKLLVFIKTCSANLPKYYSMEDVISFEKLIHNEDLTYFYTSFPPVTWQLTDTAKLRR